MPSLRMIRSATALCATVAVSFISASSFAGVMSVANKASVSLPSPTDQVDWRAYPHRHHRWHVGWYYGWPRYRIGTYASAAPLAAYGAAYPAGCGVYGSAYPTSDDDGFYGSACPAAGCGTWGYGLGFGPF